MLWNKRIKGQESDVGGRKMGREGTRKRVPVRVEYGTPSRLPPLGKLYKTHGDTKNCRKKFRLGVRDPEYSKKRHEKGQNRK